MTHVSPYVGQVCWSTTSAPGGLVVLVALAEAPWAGGGIWAQVRHVLDHPAGYALGGLGWYPVAELAPCWWPEAEDLGSREGGMLVDGIRGTDAHDKKHHPLDQAHTPTATPTGALVYCVCGWQGCAQRLEVDRAVWEAEVARRTRGAAGLAQARGATPDAEHA